MPDPVFANIGKLLLATQIYDMHRLAHDVSRRAHRRAAGTGRGPQPGDRGDARRGAARQSGRAVRQAHRGRALHRGPDRRPTRAAGTRVISLHGGGSPAAMKQEIWRHYPVGNKVELVERLLERGVLHDADARDHAQPPAGTLLRHGLQHARAAGDGGPAGAQGRRSRCAVMARAPSTGSAMPAGPRQQLGLRKGVNFARDETGASQTTSIP